MDGHRDSMKESAIGRFFENCEKSEDMNFVEVDVDCLRGARCGLGGEYLSLSSREPLRRVERPRANS